MQITLHISSEDAETILFALTLRSKQKSANPILQNEAIALGESLDSQFAKQFGWDASINRMAHYRRPIKSVSIKCYDFPPTEVK
jgi:hypothetical protein